MKVVLLQDIKKLGDANDVVEVKPGYARNYLFRQGLAVPATPAELNRIKTQSLAIEAQKERKLKLAQEAGAQLEGRTYEVTMTVGEEGRLYGSLTPMMIAKLVAEDGFDVDHRDVNILEDLRTVGTTTANVRLHTEVMVIVNVVVKGEGGEEAPTEEAEENSAEDTVDRVDSKNDEEVVEEETEETDAETSEIQGTDESTSDEAEEA